MSDVLSRVAARFALLSVLGSAASCSGGAVAALGPDVPPGHVASIVIEGAPAQPVIGRHVISLSATTLDRDDHVITGYPMAWTTTDTLVGWLGSSGNLAEVQTRSPGTVKITAYSDGRSASVTITVLATSATPIITSPRP